MLLLTATLLLIIFCFSIRYFLVNRGISRSFQNLPKKYLGLIFLAISLCLAVVASNRPTFVSKGKSYNFMVLLDISLSMYCQDYQINDKAMSRLDMAKENLIGLLNELPPGSKMGLAVLAGYTLYTDPATYSAQTLIKQTNFTLVQEDPPAIPGSDEVNTFLVTLVPPLDVKSSYDDLRQMIESIGPAWIWEGGSPITSALVRMGSLIQTNPDLYDGTAIILLTDGEEKELTIPPRKLAGQELGKNKLVVCYLGFDKPMLVPEYDINSGEFRGYKKRYGAEEFFTSSANEKFMKELSKTFGAQYLKIKSISDLKSLAHRADLKTGNENTAKDASRLAWLTSLIFFVLSLVV